jgi:hypothetical protein
MCFLHIFLIILIKNKRYITFVEIKLSEFLKDYNLIYKKFITIFRAGLCGNCKDLWARTNSIQESEMRELQIVIQFNFFFPFLLLPKALVSRLRINIII